MKYTILVTNDDGKNAAGLKPLIKELSKIAYVFTVVPWKQMSGASSAITLDKFKEVKQISKTFFAIKGGTPADCVKYALYSVLKNKCDMVVSGINTCANLGQDVIYSGTVGGAREGALLRVPSVAASMYAGNNDYAGAAKAVKQIVLKILKNKTRYKNICLNINIPKLYKGLKAAPLGLKCYDESIDLKVTGKKKYYKLSGCLLSCAGNAGSDIEACEKGFISITPLILNQTDSATLKKIGKVHF